MVSEDALQIAEKRRETKGRREKENYTHQNGEFQRLARRDKKTFLSFVLQNWLKTVENRNQRP